MTVRADFYNPLIRSPLVAARLPKQQVNIPPMSRDDLRAAIETPAKTAGLSFAPRELVDRILDDVGLEEGRLPLLQFALKETWGKREGDRLTAEAYTEVGGVAGAIEKTAEDAYERLNPAQKDAARRLFLRSRHSRRRAGGHARARRHSRRPAAARKSSICSPIPRPGFSSPATRLCKGRCDAGSEPRSTVEVAHEALIQRWPTLREWVRANRQKLRDRAAILRAKAEWEEKGGSDEFLLDPGVQLERGRAFSMTPATCAVDDIRDYVGRSIEKDKRRLDSEREAALADQKRVADARKRTSQVALAGLVIALFVAAAAVWQYLRATEATRLADVATLEAERSATDARANLSEAQIAQSRFLADLAARKRAEGDAGTTVLLALEALPDDAAGASRPYVPEAELQLDSGWRDLRERLDLGHGVAVLSAAFSPDGKRIVTASSDKTARVWDAATGQPIGEPLKGHDNAVSSAAFSPDGTRIVTASWDKHGAGLGRRDRPADRRAAQRP